MTLPARNTLAIIGAGPVGLEAAAAALDAGFDVHVFERGEPGEHTLAWGHVRMFSPWSASLGPAATARLRAAGWTPPDTATSPTGMEFAERYLQPLAALPAMRARIHAHSRVVHVSRRGLLKGDGASAAERAAHPFRLMVRDQGGRENFIHAFAVIDASGIYGQPNWAGDGGIPARGELYLAPQMSYQLDDVLDLRRARYAGKRTLVIGGGDTAATVVADLAKLAAEVPDTAVTWVTREPAAALYAELPGDPLAARRELYAAARGLLAGGNIAVRHVGGAVVDGFRFNSATHKYTTELTRGDLPALEESDQVIVNTGFGPDHSIYRELRVPESCVTRAPELAESADSEPNFHVVGHKSYGRAPHFLPEIGYRQVPEAIARLVAELRVAGAH